MEVIIQKTHGVEENEDDPIILQTMNQERNKNPDHHPFVIYLLVGYLMLHNCMLDFIASTNVMSLTVMNQLGLNTSKPYINICIIDSREAKICGLIKYLKVILEIYQGFSLVMYVVFIDVLDALGMLFSQKWDVDIGGSMQMDLSYATSPTYEDTFVTLHHEPMRRYHI
jgi:hypothetical protein